MIGGTNDDTDDLFGMELAYEASMGTGNTGLYNGNISAMKWSRNMALGAVKDVAYNYTYDKMNRLLSATYKKDTASAWINTTSAFNESDYTYDHNGNILSLKRRDAAGALMDDLTYDYGASSAQSNRLVKVTDSGNDETGFREINSSADDYVYDANGNMVWDRNKGGQEHLTNGSFDNGSSGWTVTDPSSKLNFNNGKVDVTAGAGPYITQNVVIPNAPYVVIVDITRTSGSGTISVQVGSAVQSISTTGTYVLSMMSTNTNQFFRLTMGGSWAGSINSASLRGITAITYNFLNLPEVVGNSSEQLRYIYDATGRKLCQNLYTGTTTPKKATDYAGEFIYQNDTLQFINTEEGRVIMTTGTPEYQYHLKDHLGNVRMTFTATPEHEIDTATLEDSHATEDLAKFLRVTSAKRVNAAIFDHTNGGSTGYSQRLNGSTDEKFGLARSLSVMPGDTVKAEVYAKYVDENSGNWTGALTTLMSQIAAGTTGVVYDGAQYASSTSTFPYPNLLTTEDNETPPKAYLNWLVFDRNFDFISSKSGYQQLTTAAKEVGADVAHEHLSSPSIVITEPGYVYFYLSNEETTPVEVYFDDFKVTHTKSPVVQSDDYYPFGLTFNSFQRENSTINRWKFQGQEHIEDLGLNWDSFKWRNHQPEIGRFFGIDPLSEKYYHNSPYAFAENRVVDGRELEGLEWVNAKGQQVYDPKANDGKGGYTQYATSNEMRLGDALRKTSTGENQFKKLTSSDQKTTVVLNDGPAVKDEKGLVLGSAKNEVTDAEIDLSKSPKEWAIDVKESTITLNLGSVDELLKGRETKEVKIGSETVTGDLSFTDILGVVLGHEIEHTTDENATMDMNRKDKEQPAYEVSDKMLQELKALKKGR